MPDLFNLYLRVTGLERRIEAGNFMLAETMTIPEVAEALQTALFEEVVVTIPEGFRAEEIAERLSENNVIEPDRFLAAVRSPPGAVDLRGIRLPATVPPDGIAGGLSLPGHLSLPGAGQRAGAGAGPFLDNFDDKVGSELIGGSSGLSGRDLVNLASIVEREAVQADERPLIASVYVNRLNGSCSQVGGNYLQADPTVQYARGHCGRLVVEAPAHRRIWRRSPARTTPT